MDWQKKPMTIISPTLAINEAIAQRRRRGERTLALGFGEANIPVPGFLKERLAQHADLSEYGPVAGREDLRVAVADYLERRGVPTSADQVVVGPGSKPLLYAAIAALDGPLALPAPSWVSYAAQADFLGREVVRIPTGAGGGGVPDPERLREVAQQHAAGGRPLAAVLTTIPDNPTGSIASTEAVAALVETARDLNLGIISDEIYSDLDHSGTAPPSPARLAPERTIVTTGLSKNMALGGWRLGVMRLPSGSSWQQLQQTVPALASEVWSAAPQPIQATAAWVFQEPPEVREHIRRSATLHGRIVREVAGVLSKHGATFHQPRGGFYVYPDFTDRASVLAEQNIHGSDSLASALLRSEGIATLPGAAFGDGADRLSLRLAIPKLYGEDDAQRSAVLNAEEPVSLPWINAGLAHLDEGLAALMS